MERLRTWQLFAICVVVWGTTWHAITYQLAGFPAALGVAVRFALAGAGALVVARWRGDRLAFSAADHGALALQGMFLYGLAYVAVYQAERFVPSGLVAVGYSASPLVSGIGAALLFSVATSHAQSSGPFAGFDGAWTGTGTVSLSDGSTERIRCKADYKVDGSGLSLKQNLHSQKGHDHPQERSSSPVGKGKNQHHQAGNRDFSSLQPLPGRDMVGRRAAAGGCDRRGH